MSEFGFRQSVFNHLGVYDPIHVWDPTWIAPEVLMGQGQQDSHAADVYSLGMVLFMIITRMHPFPNRNPMVLGHKIALAKELPVIPSFIPFTLVHCLLTRLQ